MPCGHAVQGRLIDHLRNTQSVGLEDLQALVLDEADRLLQMGFSEEVCPEAHRQYSEGPVQKVHDNSNPRAREFGEGAPKGEVGHPANRFMQSAASAQSNQSGAGPYLLCNLFIQVCSTTRVESSTRCMHVRV